ncbi:MAG TPA: S9 family peptidase, partial [Candidatus Dormibacteraeota bacterium]|nr:S9 family peptidase [Candidatus Dormibacteraeota bacterium]
MLLPRRVASPLLLFLVMVPASMVVAQRTARTLRPITIDDYFQIRAVSDPQLSPDGQYATYTVETRLLREDRNEDRIWMASTAGGEAAPLTAGGVSSSHARWSPDGKSIAFLSARDGGKTQVWLLPRYAGEAERLTDTPQDVEDFAWSPDSRHLVLVLRDPNPEELEAAKEKQVKTAAGKEKPKTQEPWVIDRLQFKMDEIAYLDRRRTHLYVFDLAARTMTEITSGDFDDSEPAWSPDGNLLAFTSNRSQPDPDANYDANIWVVAADNRDKGARLIQVTTNPGADTNPSWSPDGKWITYVPQLEPRLFDYATRHVAISPATGGPAKLLTLAFDRMSSVPHFPPDGKFVY